MFRHLAIVTLQVLTPIILVFLTVVGWRIHLHGWAYLDSDDFHAAMVTDIKYAIAGAVLLLVVVICYRVTRRTLDP
ncbi:MAG: hypothetical protein WDN06_17605 [Asticcacaulis sp.]